MHLSRGLGLGFRGLEFRVSMWVLNLQEGLEFEALSVRGNHADTIQAYQVLL